MANLYIEGVSIFQILLDKEITSKLPSIQRIGGIKILCRVSLQELSQALTVSILRASYESCNRFLSFTCRWK